MSFGETLQRLREKRNITQHRLGLLAQVAPSNINRIERGERGVPEVDTLISIANALDLSRDERLLLMQSVIEDRLRTDLEELSLYYLLFLMDEEMIAYIGGIIEEGCELSPHVRAFIGDRKRPFDADTVREYLEWTLDPRMFPPVRRALTLMVIQRATIDLKEQTIALVGGLLAFDLSTINDAEREPTNSESIA